MERLFAWRPRGFPTRASFQALAVLSHRHLAPGITPLTHTSWQHAPEERATAVRCTRASGGLQRGCPAFDRALDPRL